MESPITMPLTHSLALIKGSHVLNLYMLLVNFLGSGSLSQGRDGWVFISITRRVATLKYRPLNSC
jgi:hypothetical protein